ncbi:MAG: proprotein convertase P-domain-containing protein [Myxococcota bacterium]|nr:proprotein convertase P-domain-containing protein [Myxococcota bacterium]
MNRRTVKRLLATVVATSVLTACGSIEEPRTANEKPDEQGNAAEKMVDWKFDAWNYRNNPDGLRVEMNKTLADLPLNGESETPAWPDTYWPTYKDSTNARWQKTDDFLSDLSPMEKYDAAFHGWDPNSVRDLKPFDSTNCAADSFDPEYYDKLGPSAHFVSEQKGNKETRDAILAGELDDRCNAKPESECMTACQDVESESDKTICENRCNRGGVETWWGLCHAWAPAAILEKEPLHPVTIPTEFGDIVFTVGDIKALYAVIYDRANASLIGGRCNDREVDRDESTGRITSDECRDLNAGSFHVAMTNLLGLQKRGFVEDRTFNYEVWNQPVKGYTVNTLEEINVQQAHELLKVDPAAATDCVQGVHLENGDYCYNRNIDQLFKVSATLDWITESHASAIPEGAENLSRYSRNDSYTYILEVKGGEIVGGEWYGASIENHPDFVWLPFRPISGNRFVSIEQIRLLGRMSQTEQTDPMGATNGLITRDSGEINLEIPDQNPAGISHTLTVNGSGSASAIKVSIDITHTYVGDLKVILSNPDGTEHVLHRLEGGSTDDLKKTFSLDGVAGIAGDWRLRVSDHHGADIGTLNAWKLEFIMGDAEPETDVVFEEYKNDNSADIPDNNVDGINSYIDIDSDGHVQSLELAVDIEHTYLSDLEITLKKGQISKVIHNREGGSEDDLNRTYKIDEFNGAELDGRWYLHIRDLAHLDTGKRVSWTLKIQR